MTLWRLLPGAAATLVGTTPQTAFDDQGVEGGVLYTYWVHAVNRAQDIGWLSTSDTGYRPVGQAGGDGNGRDLLEQGAGAVVAVSNAVSYDVYRGVTNDLLSAALLVSTTSREWNDTGVSVAQPYYYWVQARNSVAVSPFSEPDNGWRRLGGGPNRAAVRDYDGDGRSDPALYQSASGRWMLEQSSAGPWSMPFGGSDFQAVSGDVDGDGKTDLIVFQPRTATWFALLSGSRFMLVSATAAVTGASATGDRLPALATMTGTGRRTPSCTMRAPACGNGWLSAAATPRCKRPWAARGSAPCRPTTMATEDGPGRL